MKNLNTEEFKNLNKFRKIELLAKYKVVEKLIHSTIVSQDDIDELSQDIYLILLEKDEKIISRMSYNDLRGFIITICKNQFNSKTSPFYKMQKRHQIFKANLEGFDVSSETGNIVPLNYED